MADCFTTKDLSPKKEKEKEENKDVNQCGATKKDGNLDSIARAIEQKLTGEINE